MSPLLLRFAFLGRLLGSLLRHFRSRSPRFGKTDRDRLPAALDLLARPTTLQSAGLALFHRAPDFGGCLFRIFSCHDYSPSCGKIIFAGGDGSILGNCKAAVASACSTSS